MQLARFIWQILCFSDIPCIILQNEGLIHLKKRRGLGEAFVCVVSCNMGFNRLTQAVTNCDLYTGVARFEFRLGHQIYWRRIWWFSCLSNVIWQLPQIPFTFILLQSTLQPLRGLACSTIVEYSQHEGFYRVPLSAARQTPNLEDQWLERSNSRHNESPASDDASEPQ